MEVEENMIDPEIQVWLVYAIGGATVIIFGIKRFRRRSTCGSCPGSHHDSSTTKKIEPRKKTDVQDGDRLG